jgi:hypothetical protein
VPKKNSNRNVGSYDQNFVLDPSLLSNGKKISTKEFNPVPMLNFKVPKSKLLPFDCLPNSTGIPLVNNRLKALLEILAPNDVQFFPAHITCKDGELDGYQFLNVTSTIRGIDHEKSIYSKMKIVDAILGFTYLTHKPGYMNLHLLARDEECLVDLLVDEKIKAAFDKEHITGVWLAKPEEFYKPLTIQDFIASQ